MEVTACTKAGRYEVAWHIRPLGIVGSDGIERIKTCWQRPQLEVSSVCGRHLLGNGERQ